MKQAATERQSSERQENDQPIQPGIGEASRWSFERLQSLREGPVTNRLIELIGKTRVTYPLRIYRIALDMGFLVKKDSGDDEKKMDYVTIARLICKTQDKSVKPNDTYLKMAKIWLKKSSRDDKVIPSKDVRCLAERFFEEDLFLEGFNVAGKSDPNILRRQFMEADRPGSHRPDYPLQFLLFALNKFLITKRESKKSICRILSEFLQEQQIALAMSPNAIKQALKRQTPEPEFVKGLQKFYGRIIEAYLWPYQHISFSEGFNTASKTRFLIEKSDANFPHLSILIPDWDEAFSE